MKKSQREMDGRCLPRPMRAQKAEDLSRFEAQRQRVESGVPAELLRYGRERQARRHGRKGALKQKEIRNKA
jgi:hypothetical protein